MPYATASAEEVEPVTDPGVDMRFLRDALGTETLGVTVMELDPGASGREHDHTRAVVGAGRQQGQEEVYVCVAGTVDVDCGDETVSLGVDDAVWLSPDQPRQIHNRSAEPARLVLVGAPTDA